MLDNSINPEMVTISYYSSVAFAFTKPYGRSHGEIVLWILSKEVDNVLALNPD